MPKLRFLRTYSIESTFEEFPSLAPHQVDSCNCLLPNSFTSLTLDDLSLQGPPGSLDFPSLTFLSFYAVKKLEHRMNVPALTTYHEGGGTEGELPPSPMPLLIEYGIFLSRVKLLFDFTELHRCYSNLIRLSIRAHLFNVKLSVHSANRLAHAENTRKELMAFFRSDRTWAAIHINDTIAIV